MLHQEVQLSKLFFLAYEWMDFNNNMDFNNF